ncbi:uncharacterized protein LOC103572814 [Microplitis demolitor]|uniref:uncharacterized protein LOC103572814 n=1 Tax=Microplitis demolitor TaxID=69319 RepID=UPI0004CCA465|nr:uncharacterized protein LOC103572814 [Microplitis demolitor]
MRDDHEKSLEIVDVSKNEKLVYKVRPSLKKRKQKTRYKQVYSEKVSSLTVKLKSSDLLVTSSDENNYSHKAIVDQDDNKTSKRVSVDENKEMAFNQVTSKLKTGKNEIKTGRKVDLVINYEKVALSRTYFRPDRSKPSLLTVTQEASNPIFKFNDEDKNTNKTGVIPRNVKSYLM